ncbi:MAG TPA: DUF6286 domain-containing protein [Pseudonocardiaceae bacterium]|nr:DUF6286 domain-containing protein [Pseudonocardiaceae bacterium]
MITRARRAAPASLVALVILAVCVVVAVAVLQQLSGHQPFIPFGRLAGYGRRLRLSDTPVIVAGAVAAALGLILLACALIPGKPTVLPLGEGDGVTLAGVSRAGLARALRAAAADLDGITAAKVRVRHHSVSARLWTEDNDIEAARTAAREALERRLTQTDLARPARLRVKVRGAKGRNAA